MPYIFVMEFIETSIFTKMIHEVKKKLSRVIFLKRWQRKLQMIDRTIGKEILDGIKEIKRFKKGEISLSTHRLNAPSPAKIIRKKLKLSQSAFAGVMGVSARTIQDWEQGRRAPQGPAKSLLRIAEQHPEVFLEIK